MVALKCFFAFPAIYQYPTSDDRYTADTRSYLPTNPSVFKEEPNGIPDSFENSDLSQRSINSRYPYQFIAYNISKEQSLTAADASDSSTFRFIASGTAINPTQADNERVYFIFQDSETFKAETVSRDGAKISFEQQAGFKYYRTNFWDIQKDPAEDPNVLYISQRGDEDSPDANNVFKIDITAPDYDQLLYRDFFDADGYPTAIVVDDVFGANSLTRVFGLRNSQGGNDINDSTYLTEIRLLSK